MSENNKRRFASPEQMARFNSLPNKMKVRELQGAERFYQAMEHFFKTDSDYARKEKIILDYLGKGTLAQYPPEEWGTRTTCLYCALTAKNN